MPGGPGVKYGPLFYRELDWDKTTALRSNRGNFDATLKLSPSALEDVSWWINNAYESKKHLNHGKIDHVLYTDASTKGWGAGINKQSTGGEWSIAKKTLTLIVWNSKQYCLGYNHSVKT